VSGVPVKVTQVRSTIGQKQEHRGTIRALGLGRIGQSAVHTDSPSLRGMLHRIGFLVKVEDAPQDED
jgi:large subunit ribosomal protein L30